jgi:hypothetical protein
VQRHRNINRCGEIQGRDRRCVWLSPDFGQPRDGEVDSAGDCTDFLLQILLSLLIGVLLVEVQMLICLLREQDGRQRSPDILQGVARSSRPRAS